MITKNNFFSCRLGGSLLKVETKRVHCVRFKLNLQARWTHKVCTSVFFLGAKICQKASCCFVPFGCVCDFSSVGLWVVFFVPFHDEIIFICANKLYIYIYIYIPKGNIKWKRIEYLCHLKNNFLVKFSPNLFSFQESIHTVLSTCHCFSRNSFYALKMGIRHRKM